MFAELVAVRRAVAGAIALVAVAAHAQSGLDAQCPNASATLDSLGFPLDLPATAHAGEVVVEFTIGADGSIAEATVTSASDPAFASAAVAAVKRLSCRPRPQAQRYARELAAQAVRALEDLRCAPSARPRQVRVPVSFRID